MIIEWNMNGKSLQYWLTWLIPSGVIKPINGFYPPSINGGLVRWRHRRIKRQLSSHLRFNSTKISHYHLVMTNIAMENPL